MASLFNQGLLIKVLDAIDPTLGYDAIRLMREDAVKLIAATPCLPLKRWLQQFIAECDAKLPSHKCWLEDDEYIIIQNPDNEWKHILINIEFEFEGLEQVAWATVKRYEMKHQLEPASYNQAPPGLYERYRYLYRIRISHETWLALTKLYCDRILIRKHKEQVKD
jgi:hypothetical protein